MKIRNFFSRRNYTISGLNIELDVILLTLFSFSSIFVMERLTGILAVFLVNVVIILFVLYFFVSTYFQKRSRDIQIIKLFFFLLIIFVVTFSHTAYFIILRYRTEPHLYVSDTVIQIEESIKYILQGKNFYTHDFLETPLADYGGGNFDPAKEKYHPHSPVYHHVYLPAYTLFSVPLYLVSQYFFHFYDQRIFHCILFAFSLIFLYHLPKKRHNKLMLLMLVSLNPLFFREFVIGSSHVVLLFWMSLTFLLLKKEKYWASSLFLALAVSSHQTAFFFLPFYFLYLFKYVISTNKKYKDIFFGLLKNTWPFFIICFLIFGTFILWDARSFWEDTYLYTTGKIPTSFPIFGIGFSILLNGIGAIKNYKEYFPFWIFQVLFTLPVFIFLILQQLRDNRMSRAIMNFGVTFFLFSYFSRFFMWHYLALVIELLVISYFFDDEREKRVEDL